MTQINSRLASAAARKNGVSGCPSPNLPNTQACSFSRHFSSRCLPTPWAVNQNSSLPQHQSIQSARWPPGIATLCRHEQNSRALAGSTTIMKKFALAEAQCKRSSHRLHILEKWNPLQCLVVSLHVRPHMVWVTKRRAENFGALQMCGQFWTSPHVSMLLHDPCQPFQHLTPRRLNPCLVPHLRVPLVDADPRPRNQYRPYFCETRLVPTFRISTSLRGRRCST